MVQIDPGGAVAANFRGADPEAVIMATSSKDNAFFTSVNTKETVVVEAIESRHIVDELRDDGGARSTTDDSSSKHVIDLTSNSTHWVGTTPAKQAPTILVESTDMIDVSEHSNIVVAEDRDYDEVHERDEPETQREPEMVQTTTNEPDEVLAESSSPEDATPNRENKTEEFGASILSALFACIDPTYGYEMPVTKVEKKTDVPSAEREATAEDTTNKVQEPIEMAPVAAPSLTKSMPATPSKPDEAANVTTSAPDESEESRNNDPFETQSDEEEDSQGQKLLNLQEDLASVPSVQEDLADSVAPMEPEDLNTHTELPSSPSGAGIVEENFKTIESHIEEASQKSGLLATPPLDEPKVKKDEKRDPKAGKTTPPKQAANIDGNLEGRRRILTKELRSVVAAYGRYDLRCANVSAALGDVMDEDRDHGHAAKLHQDAVSIYSCKLGDDHSTTLKAKMRLGAVLENAGEIEQAINLYYQVTVMRKALRGDKDESVADGLVCMARALRKKEDYIQAIKELKRALKIYRQSLGDSDDKVSSTVDDIASLYITIGDFTKSAAILEEVVKLKAATLGPRSNQVGNTLLQLASAYECAGEQANAIRSLKKAYKIFSETGGHSGEESTSTLNRMAMLYEATKDHNRAAVAFLGVLRSRKIHFGAQHTAVGETYFHLGRTLRLTTQYDKALKCLKEALPIFVGQGAEVDDVKMVADIMHEMAMVNQDRGNYKDAARIFKQELSVRRKIGQPTVPFISRTLLFMGIADYSMKNFNQALKNLVEALALFQERGDEGLDCAKVLYYTGLVFEKVDNRSRAAEALAEAVRLFEENDIDSDSKILSHAQEKINYLRSRK